MIALWTRRLWPYAVILVVAAMCVVWPHRAKYPLSRQQAHQATIYAEHDVYRTDTLYHRDTVLRRVAVADYRTARDTLVITDTVQVRAVLQKADTALARDSVALADANARILAGDRLTARVRAELAIAEHPSRFALTGSALYDPIAQAPAAALEASVRLAGRVALVARAEQRFATGERPRAYLGVQSAF